MLKITLTTEEDDQGRLLVDDINQTGSIMVTLEDGDELELDISDVTAEVVTTHTEFQTP
jgi:hypothetical protein